MKLNIAKWSLLPVAVLTVGTVAFAQDPAASTPPSTTTQVTPATTPAKKPTIQQRKRNQQARIAQGVKSGQLTPAETAKLEKQEHKINKEERKDRAANGGTLTASDRKEIRHDQNQESRKIYRKKHNARTQGGVAPAAAPAAPAATPQQ